ncbi:hypothetical protein EMCG_03669 [[Emmonsia] crescens]|uniref:Uncharacterized protein n=1 Tax=[Emmonsia] crescens TaxID=73230 RepID=A0A0G2IZZ4_9EURO|nr:hypothetical protein EMCG_03669 [Emmonsia crescens UAMH 3008]
MGFLFGFCSYMFHRTWRFRSFAGRGHEEQTRRSNQVGHDIGSHDIPDYFRGPGGLFLPNIWHF